MTAVNSRCQRLGGSKIKRVVYEDVTGSSVLLNFLSRGNCEPCTMLYCQIIMRSISFIGQCPIVGLRYQPRNGNLHIVGPDFCFLFFLAQN